jgi:branched-chain amino acid transport system permease protein
MTHVIQIVVDGVVIGSTYALVALGFTLVFGVLGTLNMAHADFYMLGAYVSLWVGTSVGALAGVLAAVLAGAAAGALLYLVILRRLDQQDVVPAFIATIGISFFLENIVARVVGPQTQPSPPLFPSTFHYIYGVAISDAQILLIGATIIIGIGMSKWVGSSSLGRDMRALAENNFLARTVGVRAGLVMMVTLAVASAIAALGGVLVTNVTLTVTPFMSIEIAVDMFVVAMIAGAGSIGGSVVGGLGLGIAESFAVAYLGSGWQYIVGLLLLIVVLMVRPQGLFGRATRVG